MTLSVIVGPPAKRDARAFARVRIFVRIAILFIAGLLMVLATPQFQDVQFGGERVLSLSETETIVESHGEPLECHPVAVCSVIVLQPIGVLTLLSLPNETEFGAVATIFPAVFDPGLETPPPRV